MKSRWSAIFCPLIAVILAAGCYREAPSGDQSGGTAAPAATATSTVSPLDSGKQQGYGVLRAGDRRIPVYTDFKSLEPIFHQQNDSAYVINFWATWCKPCVEELPYFEQLHRALAGKKARIILVSLDFAKELEKKLIPFVQERQLQPDVVVLLDGAYNDWIDKVSPEWGGAIPVTLIYNARERRFIGEQLASYRQLEEAVKGML